jgi:hypothetical protein
MLRRAAALLYAAAAVLGSADARAQLGDNGRPITTSRYTLDLYEGPVLAGARVIGIGGAYAPIAEGVAGYAFNPAAAALRVPWSVDWFDWDLDGGFTLPSALQGNDFDNNGDHTYASEAKIFLTGGGGLSFGRLGVGANVDFEQFSVGSKSQAGTLDVNIVDALAVSGFGFFRHQLLVGIGVGLHSIRIERPRAGQTPIALADVTGFSGHLGAIWAPIRYPVRVGVAVRLSPTADMLPDSAPNGVPKDADGNYVTEGYYLPRTIALPTEIHAGIAVQLFRPLNLGWVRPGDEPSAEAAARHAAEDRRAARERDAKERLADARAAGADVRAVERAIDDEDERAEAEDARLLKKAKTADHERRLGPYRALPRRKLLASFAVKITTITTDGVGLESFLRQRVERSGEEVSFSPRVGLETELLPNIVVLRAGSYYEPTRFRTGGPRVHGTGGLDLRIPFEWDAFGLLDERSSFRVGGAVDGALRYFGWSVSAGLWH